MRASRRGGPTRHKRSKIALRSDVSRNEFRPRPAIRQVPAMQYQNVCLEAVGYSLPEETVTSEEIERRLEPLYQRLRLPEGRLELMSGIRERRFWEPGVLPSDKSIESGELAIDASGIDRRRDRGADPRLRVPRLPRASHGLPRASRPGIEPPLRPVRRVECLPGADERRLAGGKHDRTRPGPRGPRPGYGKQPAAGRNDDRSIESRRLADAQQRQVGGRFPDDWIGQRRGPVDGPATEPHGQSPAIGRRPRQYGLPSAVPQRPRRSHRQRHAAADGNRLGTTDAGGHRHGRGDFSRVPGSGELAARGNRPHVLPSSRRDASEADARVVGIGSGTRFRDVPLAGQHRFGGLARDAGHRIAGRSRPSRRPDRHAGDWFRNQLRDVGRPVANDAGRHALAPVRAGAKRNRFSQSHRRKARRFAAYQRINRSWPSVRSAAGWPGRFPPSDAPAPAGFPARW